MSVTSGFTTLTYIVPVQLGTFHAAPEALVGETCANRERRLIPMAAEPSDSGHVRVVGAFAGVGSGEAVAMIFRATGRELSFAVGTI